jgi:DNA adenine methylase
MQNKPLFRWAGSKAKLLPSLEVFWSPNFSRYIEPFAGSASLYFRLAPQRAILNDINSDLIHCYKRVRTEPTIVSKRLRLLKKSKKTYLRLRAQKPRNLLDADRAARFIYLNRYCFNGLYRTNSKGEFNVPYAPEGAGRLPTKKKLERISQMLKGARLLSQDFEQVIRTHVKQEDFVYLDPPYAVGNRRVFKQYGPQVFGNEDLKRLSKCLGIIQERGASFVLSYAYCREAVEAFSHWTCLRVFTQRNISGFAQNRRRAAEMIVTNIKRNSNARSRKAS